MGKREGSVENRVGWSDDGWMGSGVWIWIWIWLWIWMCVYAREPSRPLCVFGFAPGDTFLSSNRPEFYDGTVLFQDSLSSTYVCWCCTLRRSFVRLFVFSKHVMGKMEGWKDDVLAGWIVGWMVGFGVSTALLFLLLSPSV